MIDITLLMEKRHGELYDFPILRLVKGEAPVGNHYPYFGKFGTQRSGIRYSYLVHSLHGGIIYSFGITFVNVDLRALLYIPRVKIIYR